MQKLKGASGNLAVNVSLLLITVLICLSVVESILRIAPISDIIGWNRVPSIQERIERFNKLNGKVKVVVLGDSFAVWRLGGSVNMFDIIQNRVVNKKVALLNLAKSGLDIDGYIGMYEKYVSFKPDYIIMCVYLSNDIANYGDIKLNAVSSDNLASQDLRGFLKRHSILANLLFRGLKYRFSYFRSDFLENNLKVLQKIENLSDEFIQNRINQISPEILKAAKSDRINAWTLAAGIAKPLYYKNLFGLTTQDALTAADRSVSLIKAFYETRGVDNFLVIFIPESLQVSQQYDDFFKQCGFDLSDFPLSERQKLTKYIAKELSRSGIKTLDLTGALQKATNGYIDGDIHLNAEGHKIAADSIYEVIEKIYKNDR